jgi:vacuolar-type H+-ATPase subunit F/Vma7
VLIIGNQDAVWGFALAGVHGKIVTTAKELDQALDAALVMSLASFW